VGDENIRIIGEKSNLEKAVGTTLTGKSLLVVWYVNGALDGMKMITSI
jgi:hypothetical protein